MNSPRAKKRIRALIVGIERYEQDDLADLDGPAIDAARVADWLYKSGVQPKEIAIFLEPLPQNEQSCSALTEELNVSKANSKNILAYLREPLRNSVSEILVVFWAGHGSMLANEDRIVFFPDGSEELRPCLNVSDLLSTMASKAYANHSNQHFFVDACADFLKPDQNVTPVQLFSPAQSSIRNMRAQRFALFSAAPGEQSANLRGTKTGLASNALMVALRDLSHWPNDPSDLYDKVRGIMKAGSESGGPLRQHPYITRAYPRQSTSELAVTSEFLADAGTIRMMNMVEAASPTIQAHPGLVFDLENEEGVSRFRRKSLKAFADAGKVPPSNLNGEAILFSDGLYVKRDLEEIVLREIHASRMVTPIRGVPGAGKTSLLWGVGAGLTKSGWDVLFVQAPWLSAADECGRVNTVDHLLLTAKTSKAGGNHVVTLIDTADALISQDRGLEALEQLVEALNAENIPVVITCRPEEAKALPPAWSWDLSPALAEGLGDFSTSPSEDRPHSEFELAIASHVRAYQTRTGHSTEFLVHQLANAVSRRKPMARFCLRPLFLRMLFDLYAPFIVPENLSITMLYEQYWAERVEKDRRSTNDDDETTPIDLSQLVMALGKEMLKRGGPELRVSSISPKAALSDFRGQIEELRRRGLGEVTDGIFTFFHQTFFEFAAAKSLLKHSGAGALCVLLDRARQDIGNYFLVAVLEQTWLCAWTDTEWQCRSSAIAAKVLDSSNDTVSGVMRQAALNVVAQAPLLTPKLWSAFHESVRNDPFDVFITALRLLPAPARLSGPQEVAICKNGMFRADEARSEALLLLGRLTDAAPEKIVPLIEEDLPFVPPQGRELEHATIKLVASLVPHGPSPVLGIMSKLVDHAVRTARTGLLEVILSELVVRPGSHSRDVASWCTRKFVNPEPKLQRLLAQIHAQGIAVELDAGRQEQVLGAFWHVMERLMTGSHADPPQADRDIFAGTLLSAVHPQIRDVIPKLVSSVLLSNHPRMHSWLHQGLLVPILNSASTDLQDFVALQIARGLPAPSSNHETGDSHWADTLRRSLARLDVDSIVLKNLTEEVERLVSMKQTGPTVLWLEPDYLLDLLVRSAVAGVATAQDVMHALETGIRDLERKAKSRLAHRLKATEGSSAEKVRALKLLVAFREINAAKTLIEGLYRDGPEPLQLPELEGLINHQLSQSDPAQRAAGWDLFKVSVLKGLSSWPEISLHESEIAKSKGDPPLALIELLELGLSRLAYGPEEALSLTSQILDLRRSIFHEKKESALRRTRVRALALAVPAADWQRILDEVFTPPVENNLLANAASILVDQHRPHIALAPGQKLEVLLRVGHRTTEPSISRIATKRAVTAWRRGIGETLRALTSAERIEVLKNLQRMNIDFAVEIATQLHIQDSESLRTLAQTICIDEETPPRLRKTLHNALKQSWTSSVPRAWLELDGELDRHARLEDCHYCRPDPKVMSETHTATTDSGVSERGRVDRGSPNNANFSV